MEHIFSYVLIYFYTHVNTLLNADDNEVESIEYNVLQNKKETPKNYYSGRQIQHFCQELQLFSIFTMLLGN